MATLIIGNAQYLVDSASVERLIAGATAIKTTRYDGRRLTYTVTVKDYRRIGAAPMVYDVTIIADPHSPAGDVLERERDILAN